MRRLFQMILALMFFVGITSMSLAAEHGGQEHGGKEHGGIMAKVPSNEDIRNAMQTHVQDMAAKTGGFFEVDDPNTGKVRRLTLVNVHERVGKTGDYYYSCADFKDADSNEMLDLDLDVADNNGTLSVVAVRIHKDNGVPRYTYDENDNRIPLGDAVNQVGEEEMKGSAKGSMHEEVQEHGGQEHGGKEHGGN